MSNYRPNVAALLVRNDGRLLIGERLRIPGAWQLPQGGIDPGETPEQALFREVFEEVGIPPQHYDIELKRDGYKYDYPSDVMKKKIGRYIGQEQTYFLCRLHENFASPNIQQEPREFSRYRWIKPRAFQIHWLPPFKKGVYSQVFADFFGVKLR